MNPLAPSTGEFVIVGLVALAIVALISFGVSKFIKVAPFTNFRTKIRKWKKLNL